MRKNIRPLFLFLLLLCVSPALVFAQSTESVPGSFGIALPPVLDELVILEAGTVTVPNDLSPLQWYDIKVSVTDLNGIGDLNKIRLRMWYDADGTKGTESGFNEWPGTGHAFSYSRMEVVWDRENNQAALTPILHSSWDLNTAGCQLPEEAFLANPDNTIFTFTFRVMVSRVARETRAELAKWHIGVQVEDEAGLRDFTIYQSGESQGIKMNWYGEIHVPSGEVVDWGDIPPGTDFADDHAHVCLDFPITYYSNGEYNQQVKASSSWARDGGGTATLTADASSENTFALKADGRLFGQTVPDQGDAVTVTDNFETIITLSPSTETGHQIGPESEPFPIGWNDLFIRVNPVFPSGLYSGVITYGVSPLP